MNQEKTDLWSQSAEQLQQQMTSGWTGAMQASQNLMPPMQAGMPTLPDGAAPTLQFSASKLPRYTTSASPIRPGAATRWRP